MFHWSRPGVPPGRGEGAAPFPTRRRSLRAATSHSHLPGDRGASGTRLERGDLDRDFQTQLQAFVILLNIMALFLKKKKKGFETLHSDFLLSPTEVTVQKQIQRKAVLL